MTINHLTTDTAIDEGNLINSNLHQNYTNHNYKLKSSTESAPPVTQELTTTLISNDFFPSCLRLLLLLLQYYAQHIYLSDLREPAKPPGDNRVYLRQCQPNLYLHGIRYSYYYMVSLTSVIDSSTPVSLTPKKTNRSLA